MTATITYRKTRDGEWVAYGPAAAIRTNTYVTVTKKSGQSKREYIDRIGRPFTVAGAQMRYGYIGTDPEAALAEAEELLATPVADWLASTTRQRPTRRPGGICAECDQPRRNLTECLDSSGIPGMCCPRCAATPRYERSFA